MLIPFLSKYIENEIFFSEIKIFLTIVSITVMTVSEVIRVVYFYICFQFMLQTTQEIHYR